MIYRCRQSIGDIGCGLLAAYVASIVGSILYRAVTRSFDFWDGVRRFAQIGVKSRWLLPGSRPWSSDFPSSSFFFGGCFCNWPASRRDSGRS
jgi:hypothetical protein